MDKKILNINKKECDHDWWSGGPKSYFHQDNSISVWCSKCDISRHKKNIT
jgi:hypothetical protein